MRKTTAFQRILVERVQNCFKLLMFQNTSQSCILEKNQKYRIVKYLKTFPLF